MTKEGNVVKTKPDSMNGIFLDMDFEQTMTIDLPLVKGIESIQFGHKKLSVERRTFGEFCFLGDMHYGNKCFSSSVLHGYIRYLKDHPNVPIGLMGDYLEYGEVSKYIRDETMSADEQISSFAADFKPLAKRIKFILWGNHEERYVKVAKVKNLMRTLAFELGIDPDGGKCFLGEPQRGVYIFFKAGDKTYGCYAQHSKTSARVNQDVQLARSGSQNVVALLAHGHTHRLIWKPRTFRALEEVNGQMVNTVRRQYLLATGCFLKYPSYAEAGSFPYTEVGAPILRFFGDHNEISQYDLTNKYREYVTRGGSFHQHAKIDINEIQDRLGSKVARRCLS